MLTSPTCGSLCVLKTMAAKGASSFGVDLDRVVALGALEGVQLFHLVRVRHELDDRREHGARAVVERGGDAEERKELHALHRVLHRGDGLVARDLLAVEVALEQRVVGGGDGLDQLVVVAVELRLHLGGDVGLLVGAALRAAARVDVRLLVEEVDDAVKVGALAHRHFDRDDLVGEARLDLLVDGVEVGVLLVHHRDDEEHGVAAGDRLAEHALGSDFDARRGADHAEGAVGGGQSGNRVALEVEEAGRVEQVDLAVHPLGVCAAEVDGVSALDLLRARCR